MPAPRVTESMLGDEQERGFKVSATAVTQPQSPLDGLDAPTPPLPDGHESGSEGWERDKLIDRLSSLRRMLPVLAQEMASARRQAARLTVDNRRLTEQVRELRAELEARASKAA
jgi:hypothetical protein